MSTSLIYSEFSYFLSINLDRTIHKNKKYVRRQVKNYFCRDERRIEAGIKHRIHDGSMKDPAAFIPFG